VHWDTGVYNESKKTGYVYRLLDSKFGLNENSNEFVPRSVSVEASSFNRSGVGRCPVSTGVGANAGSSSSDNGGNDGTGNNPPTDGIAELEGTWKSVCDDWSDDVYFPIEGSSVLEFTFSGNLFSAVETYYFDTNCSEFEGTELFSGIFVAGKSFTTGAGLAAKELDLTYLKQDGKNVNYTYYDIYSLINGKLYFGDRDIKADIIGESPNNRPKELGLNLPYFKSK